MISFIVQLSTAFLLVIISTSALGARTLLISSPPPGPDAVTHSATAPIVAALSRGRAGGHFTQYNFPLPCKLTGVSQIKPV